jgi:hypothetical protein
VAIEKIYKGIANFINNSTRAQSTLKQVSKNPALAGATSSFILSTTIRPATIMAVTPDKNDAKYGACSSISAAFVELVGSYALFKPMNKVIENSSKQLYKTEGSIYEKNPLLLRRYKSITNRVAKLPLTFFTSVLRFSMIYPLSLALGAAGIVKSTHRGEEDKKRLDIKA